MVHVSGTDGVWSADVADSSGNGNALSVWTGAAWAGYVYKSDVPFSSIPQTGVANNFSVKNSGGSPGMWNNTLRTWSPSAWTVEASFKPENGGWRTIVGRDSRAAATQPGGDANAAALYFQLQPENRVAVTFQDVMGYGYTAVSAAGAVQGFDYGTDPDGLTGKWYSMAGVSDGSKLSLYLNDIASGKGYQLVAQTDLTLQGSTNTALTVGLGSGSDWTAGDFSVGRGLYNGGHVDRAYGFIDEVRLSDTALTPNQFLAAAPTDTELRGTVTDSLTGNPAVGATVTLGTRTALTDTAGKYSVFNTASGTFPLTVTSPYSESTFTATVTLPAAGFITKDVTLPIRPHLSLDTASGNAWKVLGNTGSAADYSAVAADESSFQTISVPANWDATVGVTDDIFGWYRLHITLPANFNSAFPGRLVRFHVGPGSAIDDIDATYVNGTLIGSTGRFPTVALPVQPVDHTNPPFADLPVVFYPGEDLAYNNERSYFLSPSLLRPGQDNVIAIKVFDFNGGGGVQGTPTLEVMTPTGAVTGTFKVGGVGVAGVRVSGMDVVGTTSDWTFTDAAGKYTLTHVTPGVSVIGAAKPGFAPQAVQTTVPAGGAITINFTSTAVTDGGPAPLYDDFSDGPDGWMAKWNAISLENNTTDNAPTVTEPGWDMNTGATIPSSITVQTGTANRGGILSKSRISRYASVTSAKLVSGLSASPEPTGGDPNVILRIIGAAEDDPTKIVTGSRYYEYDIEGYVTLDNGAGTTEQRVAFRGFSQAQGQTAFTPVPLPISRIGDVSPTNPLVLTIVRTGSIYDTYACNSLDGVTGAVLLHTDNIPDTGMLDHKIFPYSYHADGKNTWDWVRAAGAAASQPPMSLAMRALRIAGGLDLAPSPATTPDFLAMNVVNSGGSSSKIDMLDALALAKQGL
ncbi:MAG TPA: carboxypeptidase regulatory-like domain-containing protein [Armatimonadota bacterium]